MASNRSRVQHEDLMYDPVEDTYPTRAQCPICGKPQSVLEGGILEEHTRTSTQLDVFERYSCKVTIRCDGSGAKVSKWRRVGRR